MEVQSPKLRLSPGIFPNAPRLTFIPKTANDLLARSGQPRHREPPTIRFSIIDSDGKCAFVMTGLGASFDKDIYEKRGDDWHFVRRVGGASMH